MTSGLPIGTESDSVGTGIPFKRRSCREGKGESLLSRAELDLSHFRADTMIPDACFLTLIVLLAYLRAVVIFYYYIR